MELSQYQYMLVRANKKVQQQVYEIRALQARVDTLEKIEFVINNPNTRVILDN